MREIRGGPGFLCFDFGGSWLSGERSSETATSSTGSWTSEDATERSGRAPIAGNFYAYEGTILSTDLTCDQVSDKVKGSHFGLAPLSAHQFIRPHLLHETQRREVSDGFHLRARRVGS